MQQDVRDLPQWPTLSDDKEKLFRALGAADSAVYHGTMLWAHRNGPVGMVPYAIRAELALLRLAINAMRSDPRPVLAITAKASVLLASLIEHESKMSAFYTDPIAHALRSITAGLTPQTPPAKQAKAA